MKRGDCKYHSDSVVCCKLLDWWSVTMCFSSISGMQSTSTVQRISHKKSILIPDIIKMYNQGMCGVDLVDQRTAAYHLDRKSWIRFYLCIFFDFIDVTFRIYKTMHQNDLTCLFTKPSSQPIWLVSTQAAPPEQKAGSKRKHQYHFEPNNLPLHPPECQQSRKRCWVPLQRRTDQTNFREMHRVWCIFVSCKGTKLVSKTSFLADWKKYRFMVVFFSLVLQKFW